MSQNKYSVEYAKTGRSLCKNSKCKGKIEKDSLRIAKIYPSDRFEVGGTQTDWYHYNCLFDALSRARKDTKKIESEDDLQGFIGLADADQELINDCLKGKIPPPGSNKGNGSDESDSKTAKKKEKKPAAVKPKAKKNVLSDSDSSETELQIGIVKMQLTEGNKSENFSKGSHFIGRDSEDLKGENARKVSRKQLELVVNQNHVTLIRRGANPSFLFSQSKKKTVAMDKDEKYEIRDGDVVGLFLGEFTFRFFIQEIEKKKEKKKPVKKAPKKEVEKKKEEKKPVKAKKEKSESTDSPKKKKGKKKNDSENEDSGTDEYDMNDSFIDDNKPAKKKKNHNPDDDYETIQEGKAFAKAYGKQLKRKMGSDDDDDDKVGGKKKCMYGAQCYRQNADHIKEFWHPPKDGGKPKRQPQKKPKYKEEDDEEEDEIEEDNPTIEMEVDAPLPPSKNKTPKKEKKSDDVAQLQELFPNLTESKIKEVLEKHGDMNEAIEELTGI
eukprot:TRINITY_DN1612_c0_g1_i1.p1 TRINITY_DN1612_c0_g1~~TRINITY_DN1612_c0_g1_i1.p1  ORF type:complete len:495 (-),score=220.95 TRINITY_DN1612_c0_g1_i1:64-1548(-)